jgi:hypothetical protein
VAKPIVITAELLERVAELDGVRGGLEKRARLMLPRAERIAAGAGAVEFGRALRVDTGVRPGAKAEGGLRRPYARVVAIVTEEMDQADAAATMSRRQILRRAARA